MIKIQKLLAKYLSRNGITISHVARVSGIKYELLRRSLNENRALLADELVAILTSTGIKLKDVLNEQQHKI